MKRFLYFMFFITPLFAAGQSKLSVDRTSIQIGDQIKATIRADVRPGGLWTNAETIWPDTLKNIEVVNGPIWNKDQPELTTATWTISVFDTGLVRIPALLVVVVDHQGQPDSSYTNDVPIQVSAVEPDSTGLKAIKGIYVQPFLPGYYKKYLPHILIGILLIVALWWWLRQRKTKRVPPVPATLSLSPEEWASQALDELEETKLWQQGDVKAHYTALTAILREYLERRFGIHAMEQTSDEILRQLKKRNLNRTLLQDTEELLSVADLIKFAKADPGIDIHAATIARVRTFVHETIPTETITPDIESKSSADGDMA